ncbi:hypothetical protein GCM10025870_06750 [Agromyces marinus]|uniref:Cadherin domain-containing protein n=1 Tax=Agromyces marinus TaxID=1389020 RepID=A0ABM8GYN2_9MICO|nr:Ig-like domain-containing protein [Agromyces marinus]BDZ53602.1 hypothetical protein GCM10025870_06750 [Agromyces marinus]
MNLRDLWNRRRSAVLTGGSVVAVVALVAGVAVASGGYTAQRIDLGDASVWVANDERLTVGRASTAVHELNAVVDTGGARAEIVQRGASVLVLDRDRASVGIVDATTSTVLDTVAVPGDAEIALAGDRVVLAADGDVWVWPADEFGSFDAESDPAVSFGPGAVVSVDEDGRIFGFVPSTGVLHASDADRPDDVRSTRIEAFEEADRVQVTSVAGRWAVFDETALVLHVEGGTTVDLDPVADPGDGAVLQRPAAGGDRVLLATRTRLVEAPLDGSGAVVLVDGRRGVPAAPVTHGGCSHAAWSDGMAWRDCGNAELVPLAGTTGSPSLAFLANGETLVLNDRRSGTTWAASGDYGVIDNWDDLLAVRRDEQTVEENDPDATPTIEKTQVPPVAVDDDFGARPGRSTLLPVLLDDYDANGDVLIVSATDGELPGWASLDIVANRQQIQLTLDADASGSFEFGYTIDDGRGGTAHANVAVTVRAPDENGAPEQVRPTRAVVEEGGRVTTAVLGEWVDPDGDPVFLRRATAEAPDRVSSTADGVVVFDEGAGRGPSRSIALVVSDGRDDGNGAMSVAVRPLGEAPVIAEPFVALATAGEEIEIEPLRHVRGGSGMPRLSAVPAKPKAEITPDFDSGTFRFRSEDVRTHYLEYTVTDGGETATGLVRVEVSAPPERDTTPITVPHTAFLRLDQPMEVDVLATDIDPTGGCSSSPARPRNPSTHCGSRSSTTACCASRSRSRCRPGRPASAIG